MKTFVIIGCLMLTGCAERVAYVASTDKGKECKHECQVVDAACNSVPRRCREGYNRCVQGCAEMYH